MRRDFTPAWDICLLLSLKLPPYSSPEVDFPPCPVKWVHSKAKHYSICCTIFIIRVHSNSAGQICFRSICSSNLNRRSLRENVRGVYHSRENARTSYDQEDESNNHVYSSLEGALPRSGLWNFHLWLARQRWCDTFRSV